jgi:outer membrane protein assembly factor BamE (lipoprotein component of BamABCDE complex)
MKKLIILTTLLLFFNGCTNSTKQTNLKKDSRLTVGVVQKEIKIGMSQSDVASALGSPNIVSSIEPSKETWIYDKISSKISYNKSQSGWTLIFLGSTSEDGNMETSQRTLTIIIKFNKGKVYDFKYHTSRF